MEAHSGPLGIIIFSVKSKYLEFFRFLVEPASSLVTAMRLLGSCNVLPGILEWLPMELVNCKQPDPLWTICPPDQDLPEIMKLYFKFIQKSDVFDLFGSQIVKNVMKKSNWTSRNSHDCHIW